MNIQIFGTKKCNDTKKAERFFKERGIKYQFIDMKEKGMSKGEFNSVAQVNGGLENMINGEGKANYLIDWEKPLFGNPAQDLGHFLAPTTTFWKTDVILTSEEIEKFIDAYIKAVGNRFKVDMIREHTHAFIPITCLRGITWCAMAWVQYQQPDKLIFNESTFKKLNAYLDMNFLKNIRTYLES